MTSEWILILLTDPQGFWKLLQHYFTVPFTGNGTDADIFMLFWEGALNHPLWLLVIVLFVLLLGGSLIASGIAIAYDSRNEKKEQEKWQLAHFQEHRERMAAPECESLIEREASYDI